MKKIMVVVAHPDDEVLGCGGTIAKHKKLGDEVTVLILSDGTSSRNKNSKVVKKEVTYRKNCAKKAAKKLGIKKSYFFNYKDNCFDSYPLLKIVKEIENKISIDKPEIIYTHHHGDLNIDHRIVNKAVITASRPIKNNSVKTLLCFEIPSSTDWNNNINQNNFFNPNWFVDISGFEKDKVDALQYYKKELRNWPHPRSVEGIKILYKYRGSISGLGAAEAFVLIRNFDI